MFVLEESQLLEDNIQDKQVLQLYKTLKHNEATNERELLIRQILSHEKCVLLIEELLKFYQLNGNSIDQVPESEAKFTPEQREDVCQKLNINISDLAPLTLVVSATLTQLYVIDNYVGPTSDTLLQSTSDILPAKISELYQKLTPSSISRGPFEVYHKIINPVYLRLVQLLLLFMNSLGCSRRLLDLEFLVWKHRYLTVYLMAFLDEPQELVDELRKIQEYIFDHHIINEAKSNKTQLVRFDIVELCCELVQSALLREGITFCRKFFDYASEVSDFSIEHTGVLGRRTRFQQSDIAQLVVKVSDKNEKDLSQGGETPAPSLREAAPNFLPKDIKLDDDTLLPDITFKSQNDEEEVVSKNIKNDMSARAQLLMLTKLDIILKSEVMEESLKDEWTLAYIRAITQSATIWSVKYKALCVRSSVEKKHTRKMDRSLLQMEELIKETESDPQEGDNIRLRTFYSVLPASRWQLQKALGDISYDLGLFKNALDIYGRIEYWEAMIRCYNALGQTTKAEQLIRQELAKKETPYLYCLLGDATDNLEYYENSWTLSKSRFARAKKSIGTHYYVRKEYAKAIEHYELAHKANPSNISILALLAYSCLTLERYERAAECYRNITYHDDQNFLAWNNLSKAYIKLNQKERAWRTLREAIKCNYEEWKIWENFMVVSIEIGALDDVIQAWHRLIDIRSAHKDDQVLSALTYQLCGVTNEDADTEYMKLLSEALKLVARLISTSECSSRLWICYFKLMIREFELLKNKKTDSLTKLDEDQKISKITNALQRATPTPLSLGSDGLMNPEKIKQVVDTFDELEDCFDVANIVIGERPELKRQHDYFKLSKSNVVKTLEKKGYTVESRNTNH